MFFTLSCLLLSVQEFSEFSWFSTPCSCSIQSFEEAATGLKSASIIQGALSWLSVCYFSIYTEARSCPKSRKANKFLETNNQPKQSKKPKQKQNRQLKNPNKQKTNPKKPTHTPHQPREVLYSCFSSTCSQVQPHLKHGLMSVCEMENLSLNS